jgi:ferritin
MIELLNKQLNMELYASSLYLAMSAWADNNDWKGFAKWLLDQSCEERSHGLKILKYIEDLNELAEIEQINKPMQNWDNLVNLFETILATEIMVTESIKNIINIALEQKDYATINFFNPFMSEQVKGISEVSHILIMLKKAGNDIAALMILDEQMIESRPSNINY